MADPEPRPRTSRFPFQIALPRFQFSLWWLMVAVTVVALCLGLGAVVGNTIVWMLFVSLVLCVLPTPLVIGALFGRGDLRAFSIGALVPWIPLWCDMPQPTPGTWFIGRAIVITFFVVATSVVCGIVAVAVQRFIERGDHKNID